MTDIEVFNENLDDILSDILTELDLVSAELDQLNNMHWKYTTLYAYYKILINELGLAYYGLSVKRPVRY